MDGVHGWVSTTVLLISVQHLHRQLCTKRQFEAMSSEISNELKLLLHCLFFCADMYACCTHC